MSSISQYPYSSTCVYTCIHVQPLIALPVPAQTLLKMGYPILGLVDLDELMHINIMMLININIMMLMCINSSRLVVVNPEQVL